MAERQFGPYRLVRQIAVGGMAEIHLAKTKGIAGFEKYVALKMIHPNFAEDEAFIQMLVDEAKIAVQLAHGNIAQTFDLGRVGDTYYITMEYVDGADLYKILRKGSEMDLEMPLDCCAFIAKEIASALDHAHRKKDHTGKPLGIVHRDVSPQNVLVSYSGEVKLVDFGIAKATMKARQTAVGVIKGKYYYMSPEQAWGDPIDFRSDIFSAGIVLYEMITGQMLYLEEDLHRLLDMARKADIAPPSRLRKGVPPQLEKIVMHALQKVPGERYQSAADFASDLERFLHAYSPVFTAAKVSGLLRQIVGDPVVVNTEADFPAIEVHDGANATFTLDTNDLVHAGDELRDENSVIFAIDELKPNSQPKMQARSGPAQPRKKEAVPEKQERAPTAPTKQVVGLKPAQPSGRAPGNMTRAHAPTEPPPVGPDGKPRPPTGNLGASAAPIPSLKSSLKPPVVAPKKPVAPRRPTDDTRQLEPAPADSEESGPIIPGSSADPATWEHGDPADDGDLANIGENTMITTPAQMRGFMRDAGEEIEATMVSAPPVASDGPPGDTSDDELDTHDGEPAEEEAVEDPTIARDFRAKPSAKRPAQPPPAALAAKIHAPAVSELRKPRPSKRTPQGGVPAQPNVLQAIVSRQASEPMPVPRAPVVEQPLPPAPPPQFPHATPGAQQAAPPFAPATGYATDASGLPLAMPTPPGMPAAPPYPQPYPQQSYPYPPPQQQPYAQPQYYPPGHPAYAVQPGYPPYPQQQQHPGHPGQPGQPHMTPGALYSMQPAPQPMTLTGQLRLFEVDEMPSQYKLGAARKRWFTYIVAGLIAISVAAAATFLIIRSTRETAPTVGSIRVESIPSGAEVVFDDVRLAGTTPLNIPSVPVNTRHTIKVELKRHERYTETVDVPTRGGELTIKAVLNPMTGKLVIVSQPEGAEVWINGEVRGRTPTTIKGLDLSSAKKLELRLKDYQPFVQDLVWPDNGTIQIDAKLKP